MPTREPAQLDRPRTFELFTLENTRDHTETVFEKERELLFERIWIAVLQSQCRLGCHHVVQIAQQCSCGIIPECSSIALSVSQVGKFLRQHRPSRVHCKTRNISINRFRVA